MNRINIKETENCPPNIILGDSFANVFTKRKLPLIEGLTQLFDDLNLENTLIVSVQHLCSTTEVLFDALLELNLYPENLYVIGKCYSTNPDVLVRLRRKGINASLSSSCFNCLIPFDVAFDRNIDEMIKQIISSNDLFSYERIIILDDGGHLLERAETFLPKGLPVVGIEQTSSGFNRMKNKSFSFPVINLARSWLKLEYESPVIIALVLKKLQEKLDQLDSNVNKVLLMGYGVLGRKIYEVLKDRYLVSIFDAAPERSTIPSDEFKTRLGEFDLIIGCTGATSLTFHDFKYLKKPVILASISSSDREFEAFKFRKLNPVKNWHSNVVAEGITLLTSGFPITFDKDYDSIDTDDFQLTRALILASVYQASVTDQSLRGFLSMEDDLQRIILTKLSPSSPFSQRSRADSSLHLESNDCFMTSENRR
jgi:S-adenosylhomocysteine hydrolase